MILHDKILVHRVVITEIKRIFRCIELMKMESTLVIFYIILSINLIITWSKQLWNQNI